MKVLVKPHSVKWMAAWGKLCLQILSAMILWCPQPCWDDCGTLTSLLLLWVWASYLSHCHLSLALVP